MLPIKYQYLINIGFTKTFAMKSTVTELLALHWKYLQRNANISEILAMKW